MHSKKNVAKGNSTGRVVLFCAAETHEDFVWISIAVGLAIAHGAVPAGLALAREAVVALRGAIVDLAGAPPRWLSR